MVTWTNLVWNTLLPNQLQIYLLREWCASNYDPNQLHSLRHWRDEGPLISQLYAFILNISKSKKIYNENQFGTYYKYFVKLDEMKVPQPKHNTKNILNSMLTTMYISALGKDANCSIVLQIQFSLPLPQHDEHKNPA